MNKSNNSILRSMVMAVLFLVGMVTVHAVNVTYKLTTHPVFGTSYDITKAVNLTAGADLLDNMPQDFWRGYTTYKFYSDEALSEEITEVPSAGGTVYVDYVFDPAYIPSVEGQDPKWNYLRGYNQSAETSSGNVYLLYKYKSSNQVWGWGYTSSTGTPPVGTNGKMDKATHCYWALYGDGFNCQIKLNDDATEYWLNWGNTSRKSAVTVGSRPTIGWQLYVNTAKNKRLSGGTVALGPYGTTNYLYELDNVNGQVFTSTIDTSKFYFDEKNQLQGTHQGNTNYRNELWWYALFATPTMATVPILYHVTYKILQADGTWYEDIVKQKTSNLKPSFPSEYEQKEGYDYDYFYMDPDFSEKCADDYTMPADENTVLYIKEIKRISTTWKTLCIPFDVDNLGEYFGEYDGEACAEVWDYTGVSTSKVYGYTFKLIFSPTDKIEANKPYLYRFVNIDEKVAEAFDATLADWLENGNLDDADVIEVPQIDESYPEVKVVMKGTLEGCQLTVQEDKAVDPYYFYFGYNAGDEAYKFYPVTKKNVTMPSFRCYFYALGTGDNSVNFSMDMDDTDGITELAGTAKQGAVNLMGVYNVNGQLVRSTGLTDGLPAGVYVVNGRKMVVK